MAVCSWTFLSVVVSNDKFPIRCVARTSDIFSIGKLVPSLLGPVVPWDCLQLQMMAAHCFIACVAIICIVAVTCHLLPVAIICVLQFVLLGALPRAILRAFWCTPSCHFACSSSCLNTWGAPMEFPEWCPDKQPAAHASIVVELFCFGRSRAIRQSYTRNSKNGALQGGLWLNYVKFGCFPRAPFCALFCAHCYCQ